VNPQTRDTAPAPAPRRSFAATVMASSLASPRTGSTMALTVRPERVLQRIGASMQLSLFQPPGRAR
jgi:hypothetical protein